jgi:hypothetical protein
MNRFDQISNIKTRNDKKRVYKTILYPAVGFQDTDIYITTNETTRLDMLAYQYYKDPSLWWIIAKANKLGGSSVVKPGEQLRIPLQIEKVISDFFTINN